MDQKEIFRQVLIRLMNESLLNDFLSIVFNYNLNEKDFVYAQYKIINGEVILDIFDNNKKNRFNAYIFSYANNTNNLIEKEINKNTTITHLYVNNCYKKFKEGNTISNIIKLAASLKIIKKEEFDKIIKGIFPLKIENIIYEEIAKNIK